MIEKILEHLDALPTFAKVLGTAIVILLPLTQSLDGNLSDEWREKLARYLKHGVDDVPSMGRQISRLFEILFGAGHVWRFVRTSIALSTLVVTLVFIYVYISDDVELPKTVPDFILVFLVPFFATLFIDVIVAYQTKVFFALVEQCRTVWGVFVLMYANILTALATFSLLFPIAAIILVLVETRQVNQGSLVFQPIATNQKNEDKDMSFLLTFGRLARNKWNEEGKFPGTIKWNIDTSAENSQGAPIGSFSIVLFSSPDVAPEAVVAFISQSLKLISAEARAQFRDEETVQRGFVLPIYRTKVEVSRAFSELPLSQIYSAAFSDITLIGDRTIDIATWQNISVKANDLQLRLVNSLSYSDAFSHRYDFVLACNGQVERIRGPDGLMPKTPDACTTWIAAPSGRLKAHLGVIATQTSARISVLPFAVSSLALTLAAWLIGGILAYTRLVISISGKVLALRVLVVNKSPLQFAAYISLAFFFLPLALILQFLV